MTRFLPERAHIEQFGAGGFRFAGMSHQGSLLVLPSGMRAWRPRDVGDVQANDLELLLAERQAIDFLIIGAGAAMARLPASVAATLRNNGISFEVMATSPAVHVYNVTVLEGRRVAAALIAVERAHG